MYCYYYPLYSVLWPYSVCDNYYLLLLFVIVIIYELYCSLCNLYSPICLWLPAIGVLIIYFYCCVDYLLLLYCVVLLLLIVIVLYDEKAVFICYIIVYCILWHLIASPPTFATQTCTYCILEGYNVFYIMLYNVLYYCIIIICIIVML